METSNEKPELTIPEVKKMVLGYLRDEYADDPDCAERDLVDIAMGFTTKEKARQALLELEAEGDVIHSGPSDEPDWDMWQAVPGRPTWDDDDDAKETIANLRADNARLKSDKEAAERERDEATAGAQHDARLRTEAEFELLALRDEVARLKRPVTGEELRLDAVEENLRSELIADEGEELTVPLRAYNQLSADALALDDEWREKLTAAASRAEALENGIRDFMARHAKLHEYNVSISHLPANCQWAERAKKEAAVWGALAALLPQAKEAEGGK